MGGGWRRRHGQALAHCGGAYRVAVLPLCVRQRPAGICCVGRRRRHAPRPAVHRRLRGDAACATALGELRPATAPPARRRLLGRGHRPQHRRAAPALRLHHPRAASGLGCVLVLAAHVVACAAAARSRRREREAPGRSHGLLLRPVARGNGSAGVALLVDAMRQRRNRRRRFPAHRLGSIADACRRPGVPPARRRCERGSPMPCQRCAPSRRQYFRLRCRSLALGAEPRTDHRRSTQPPFGHDLDAAATAALRQEGRRAAAGVAPRSFRHAGALGAGRGPRRGRHSRLRRFLGAR